MLSEEQIDVIMCDNNPLHSYVKFARAIEAAVLGALGEQKPAGTYTVSYFRGCASMPNTEFQPSIDFAEGTHNLYAAPVVQPDMVLVPREPTEEMAEPHPFNAKRVTYHKTASGAHPGVATASSEPLDELRRLAAEIGIPFDAASEAAYRAFVAAAENRK